MRELIWKMFNSELSLLFFLALFSLSFTGGIAFQTYYGIKEGSMDFVLTVAISLLVPTLVFFALKKLIEKVDEQKAKERDLAIIEERKRQQEEDREPVEKLNELFNLIAESLKYYITQDRYFVLHLDINDEDLSEEDKVLFKIEIADDMKTFIANNGMFRLFNFNVGFAPEKRIKIVLNDGSGYISLFPIQKYSYELYDRNQKELSESRDRMFKRVNNIFYDFLDIKRYPDVQILRDVK